VTLDWRIHDGSGPALLLVHGFLSSPSQWLLNLPALSAHCRPVTVTLHGHGGAPAPAAPEAYTPAAYVEAFEQIRVELGVERWFLLGYSLGAGLTIRYALTHPERIIGHIFTNSTSALADAARIAEWRDAAAASAERILEGGHAAMERIAVHPRHARKLQTPVFEALCADAARHSPLGIANTLRYTNPATSVRDRLGANVRPALLVCGARERRFRALRDSAAATMPDLRIVDLDAGHGMNMEVPDAFNDAVIAFLRSCSTTATPAAD
jgi:2-succinyl-6-hydroxy-2,4-cyclohexadiene-1-carboxylate synthase